MHSESPDFEALEHYQANAPKRFLKVFLHRASTVERAFREGTFQAKDQFLRIDAEAT
jgi:hypothetical protein